MSATTAVTAKDTPRAKRRSGGVPMVGHPVTNALMAEDVDTVLIVCGACGLGWRG